MKRKLPALAAAALVLFVGTGALLASNMSFIINCPLLAPAPGVSLMGLNTLSLPYQRIPGLNNASDLLTDIGFNNVLNVQRYVEANGTYQVYTGRKGSGPDFPLSAGECYFVRMAANVDYPIGGSADPFLALSLDPAPVAFAGRNFVSVPYHTIANSASQLQNSIGLASVLGIERFVTANNTYQVYTGRKGSGPDYALNACECYFIRMSAAVPYGPPHY